MEDNELADTVRYEVDRALLDREKSFVMGRKDWLQLAGLFVMLLIQTVYVSTSWSELKSDIRANRDAIEARTLDRFTRTEANGVINLLNHRIERNEFSVDKLEKLIEDNRLYNERLIKSIETLKFHIESFNSKGEF